ncbi:MAG TPA: hypothetical protein VF092_30920 [Longimicrobium sp.]
MKNGISGRLARLAALLATAALAACSGGDGPSGSTGGPQRVEVIVNSVGNSLTLVSPDSATPTPVTVGLGAQGTPVGVAANGATAVVPLGTYPFAAIVDLRTGTVTRTAALPANSGATGVAFLNDSIAFVGNPNRNTVSPVNVRTGAVGAEVAVGTYPQAIVASGGVLFVLNGNLVNFSPAGPGSISAIDATGKVVGSLQLTGINPQAGVVVGSRLYVINAGHFGQADGSLSVVNLVTGTEELVPGFGEFPGSIDVGPDGNLYVGVYGTGVLVWNPGVRQFVRGLDNPVLPNGAPPVSGLGFDPSGRLHTLNPGDCLAAGKAYRLNGAPYTVNRTVTTGVCPFGLAFTVLPSS